MEKLIQSASYRRGLADGADEEAPVRDSDEDYLRGYATGREDPIHTLALLLTGPACLPAPTVRPRTLREALDVEAARQRGRAAPAAPDPDLGARFTLLEVD